MASRPRTHYAADVCCGRAARPVSVRQEAPEISGDGDEPEYREADGEALLHLPLRGLDVLAAALVPELRGEKCQHQKNREERVGEKRQDHNLTSGRAGEPSRRQPPRSEPPRRL